jgi:hypothetical protein
MLKNVRTVQQNVNPRLRLAGILLTMYDPRTRLAEQVEAEIRAFLGPQVYETVIPRSIRLAEAPGFGKPISLYDPSSKGAGAYQRLAVEVMSRQAEDEAQGWDWDHRLFGAQAEEGPVEHAGFTSEGGLRSNPMRGAEHGKAGPLHGPREPG